MTFSELVLQWYLEHKRDLPWRNTRDRYNVWLSEVILQQTRVQQGLSYYGAFTEQYPDVLALAAASETEVLKLWQGLGYYSRARNLLATARIVAQEHDGIFPERYEELLKLKGIGEYTAAAIASICSNEKVPVVDGNVYRLLSRYFGIHTPIDSTLGKKEFKTLAAQLVINPSGHYNQAVMELGAMICKPKGPDCPNCPVLNGCIAHKRQEVSALPRKAKKVKVRRRYFNYLVLNSEGRLHLKERGEKDIWKGLYDFPLVESSTEILTIEELMSMETPGPILGPGHNFISRTGPFSHQLTHREIRATFWEFEIHEIKDQKLVSIDPQANCPFPLPRLIDLYLKGRKVSF